MHFFSNCSPFRAALCFFFLSLCSLLSLIFLPAAIIHKQIPTQHMHMWSCRIVESKCGDTVAFDYHPIFSLTSFFFVFFHCYPSSSLTEYRMLYPVGYEAECPVRKKRELEKKEFLSLLFQIKQRDEEKERNAKRDKKSTPHHMVP
ncbi:hypothetical protein M426DRAFT_142916 [Hypoxylon sp. CI-4A]|nr:hypothetical protein M426DRAFT_142916 [Hypoxylon sp. CI-4A]